MENKPSMERQLLFIELTAGKQRLQTMSDPKLRFNVVLHMHTLGSDEGLLIVVDKSL